MNVFVIIPARAGSRRLPHKNARTVGGVSLLARAVWAGREFLRTTNVEGRVFVDTDGESLAREGREWGAEVPFLRPDELAGDRTSTADSIVHFLSRLEGPEPSAIILLQPTSPLRSFDDIVTCWDVFASGDLDSVLSVSTARHGGALGRLRDGRGILRHPQADGAAADEWVEVNGSVYIVRPDWLREMGRFDTDGITVGVTTPSGRAVDVDTPQDLHVAEALAGGVTTSVDIGGRVVGHGEPCFIIANAGISHAGDVDVARRLVDVAADAGVDALAFETSDADRPAADDGAMTGHREGTPRVGESGRGTPDASVLGPDTCEVLRQHAESRGVMLLSTPLDEQTRDDAVAPRLPAIRIPSAELINHPFLAHVAGRGRAILMSTGMATMAEVADAVAVLRAHGDPPLVLLHCVTNSPADASESNLDAMRSLESLFGVPVGWSDNTRGLDVVVAAAARGATIIEKRVRLDRGMVGPHNEASLEADELRMMVDRVRRVESAIGSGIKTPTSAEERIAGLARKSLHAVRDLAPGHELITDDLVAVRPADGIAPAKLATVVGRRLTTSVAAGMPILEQHLGE